MKQQLNRLWDRLNLKYERAQDNGDTREVYRLWRQMREINRRIELI